MEKIKNIVITNAVTADLITLEGVKEVIEIAKLLDCTVIVQFQGKTFSCNKNSQEEEIMKKLKML